MTTIEFAKARARIRFRSETVFGKDPSNDMRRLTELIFDHQLLLSYLRLGMIKYDDAAMDSLKAHLAKLQNLQGELAAAELMKRLQSPPPP
jgi:hypothetical protein